jgi:hypothetical protein
MIIRFISLAIIFLDFNFVSAQNEKKMLTYSEYIQQRLPSKEEIRVFLNEDTWAHFDSEMGYILGTYLPHDGIDGSSTISTVQKNGARTSFMYSNKHCRINTYGNSFTQCQQVSDGETWQEYLAAHIGEPVRNYGVGGYGVYQSFRRLLKEERTKDSAEYIIFYIWGDDHIRSLLRCRYILTSEWTEHQRVAEGEGKMFHGNFWPNLELNIETGKWVENDNPLKTPKDLYKMTDPSWMLTHLENDLALQMSLFLQNKIQVLPNIQNLKKLSHFLGLDINLDLADQLKDNIRVLLNKYSFEATKYILERVKKYTDSNNKKLMVVIFDPYTVTKPLLQLNKSTRYDQEIVDYLSANKIENFDMNLVHVADFKLFKLSTDEYFKKYFVGHYNPTGNHFFAYSIKPSIVNWLTKKPVPYSNKREKNINFKDYLNDY